MLGSWILKNIFLFSIALAEHFGWRLLTKESLWSDVVTHKYIFLDSIKEWIRNLIKKRLISSIIWKAVIKSFQVVGDGLAWEIGNDAKNQVGYDPWAKNLNNILPEYLTQQLHQHITTIKLYTLVIRFSFLQCAESLYVMALSRCK